jgi:hypothetical protein
MFLKVYYGFRLGYIFSKKLNIDESDEQSSWVYDIEDRIKMSDSIEKHHVDFESTDNMNSKSYRTNGEDDGCIVVGIVLNSGSAHYNGLVEIPQPTDEQVNLLKRFIKLNRELESLQPKVYCFYDAEK